MLTCKICGYEHETMISPTHLKKHGLNGKEYKEKFPGSILRIQSFDSKIKISESKRGIPSARKGLPLSDEHKIKLSTVMKEKYFSGEMEHWNLGKSLSEKTKQKISESCRGRKLTDEQQIKWKIAVDSYRDSESYIPPMLSKKHSVETRAKLKQASTENNKMRQNTIENIQAKANENNFTVVDYISPWVICRCNTCQNDFKFTSQMFNTSSIRQNEYCPICFPRQTIFSKSEKEMANFIKSIYNGPVTENDRAQLEGKEIDIFLPMLNIGFEYTGLYWHAELQNPETKHLLWKSQFARKKGIRLITIFEDEWREKQDIVKSRISNILGLSKNKVFARLCKVQEISHSEKSKFLKLNHIQSDDRPKFSLGLFYNDELVSVMTFKKTNMVKGGTGDKWELSRFCNKLDTIVVGGAGKLLSYFKKKSSDDRTIISYADMRWSDGNLYKQLGFDFIGTSSPSYWYIPRGCLIREHRSKFMKHMIIKKFEIVDSSKTEWEIMKEFGYDRIWDCGTSKWELSLK